MLEKILEWDSELFLYLNSKNTGWLDPAMLLLSSYTGWIVISMIMLIIVYINGGLWKRTGSVFFLFTVGLSGLLTNIIKVIIERPRPIHNAAWQDMIHAIEKYESSYSFFSSHSATTFSMAVFFFLYLRTNRSYRMVAWLALIWAGLVSYSRIYVAKHFPIDVGVGILFGIAIGIAGYKLFEYYKIKRIEYKESKDLPQA